MGKLPTIVIAGFQKCGTTALQEILLQCPDIRGPRLDPGEDHMFSKEVHFFDMPERFARGVEWYKGRFSEPCAHAIDSTPEYARGPLIIQRMASTLPDAKIIVLMRDPIDRAYSAWNHWKQEPQWDMFLPTGGFEENIGFELGLRKAGQIETGGMLTRGFYSWHIENLDNHYSRDQIYLGYSDDLRNNQDRELGRIFEFLEIDFHPSPPIRANTRTYQAPLAEETRRSLREVYRPFDEKLEARVGAPPPWLK